MPHVTNCELSVRKISTSNVKKILVRITMLCVVVLVYFIVWKEVRVALTSYLMIPQAEAASVRCDTSFSYERVSNTAMVIYRDSNDSVDIEEHRVNAPAGFYLLFGIFFIVLLKGGKKFYGMILGYHAVFTVLLVTTFYVGLCYAPFFLHLSAAGNSYFTPFFTFFVLLLLFIPSFRERFEQKDLESS